VKPGSIHLIHDGIESGSPSVDNVERLKKKLNLPSNSKVVGTVGRITRWKGVHVFIDAAREVLADCPETHFLVVGSPDTEQARKYFLGLRKKVLDQGLSERIHFTGFREDIPQLLSVMDVFILPSIFPEPFGLVTLEAMLARKPVIVTAHGGSLDIVSDQKEGYLCRPADCGELAEKIKRLLNDPALCQSMGDCGYKRATEDFEVKVQVEKIMNCYNQWLSSDSRERQKRS
ncbi:MAG: glycosyltransferase family 4 protein, partial [Nitrospinales bacterium]